MINQERQNCGEFYTGIADLIETLDFYECVFRLYFGFWEADMVSAEKYIFVLDALSKEFSKTLQQFLDYFAEFRGNDI